MTGETAAAGAGRRKQLSIYDEAPAPTAAAAAAPAAQAPAPPALSSLPAVPTMPELRGAVRPYVTAVRARFWHGADTAQSGIDQAVSTVRTAQDEVASVHASIVHPSERNPQGLLGMTVAGLAASFAFPNRPIARRFVVIPTAIAAAACAFYPQSSLRVAQQSQPVLRRALQRASALASELATPAPPAPPSPSPAAAPATDIREIEAAVERVVQPPAPAQEETPAPTPTAGSSGGSKAEEASTTPDVVVEPASADSSSTSDDGAQQQAPADPAVGAREDGDASTAQP